MSDSVQPHRWQPTRLPRPWVSPDKNTEVGCHFLLQCMKMKSENEVAQSCPTLSDPMDYILPGCSIHGICQARVLEWGAIAFSICDQHVLWKNSVSLCPASFCTPRPNLPVVADISWLPTFAFQSPMMKKTSFLVLVLKDLTGLCGTGQLELLQHQWLGHRLWWLWCWIVCLGNKLRSFCHFWHCPQVLHFGLFCWLWGLLHFF